MNEIEKVRRIKGWAIFLTVKLLLITLVCIIPAIWFDGMWKIPASLAVLFCVSFLYTCGCSYLIEKLQRKQE